MAIRIRKVGGELVALCAAKSQALEGDIYLDDGEHYALSRKYWRDYPEIAIVDAEDIARAASQDRGEVMNKLTPEALRDYPKAWFEMGFEVSHLENAVANYADAWQADRDALEECRKRLMLAKRMIPTKEWENELKAHGWSESGLPQAGGES
jgi:hypothetical protein